VKRGGHRSCCNDLPAAFVSGGNFGWTAGTRRKKTDLTFALAPGSSATNLNARRFECLLEVLSQHVLFARLRIGLKRRGWTLDSFVGWLVTTRFPAGEKIMRATIKKAATGEYRLDPRDRAVVEAFCEPLALGPSAYGGQLELCRVVKEVLQGLGVVITWPAGTPTSRLRTPASARPSVASVRGTPGVVAKINELIDKHPDILEILDDVGRLQVKVDPTGVGGPKPPSTDVRDLAVPDIYRAITNLRRPVTAFYRLAGELGPGDRLPNLELTVSEGDDEEGDVEGWIEPELCYANVELPQGWAESVGRLGWDLLGGRFVFNVVSARPGGQPLLVRAMALMAEDYLEVANPSVTFLASS
jgi:hypothetical protein